MRRLLVPIALMGALAAVAVFVVPLGAAASQNTCPPNPPPGSKVNGGLDVTGVCVLDNVTVNGGINVSSTGRLQFFNNSVAHGGITVDPGGELDVNATTLGGGQPTNTRSTIDGGIDLNGASDFDIWTADINGGITITGPGNPGFQPFVCANDINGTVKFNNVTGYFRGPLFGDPDEGPFGGARCAGNSVHGSIHTTNSSVLIIESNAVTGSAILDATTLELNGNTFGGSIKCKNGTVIVPGEPGDPPSNTCS